MAMREFLDADCGQLNPVLKVASHFTQDVGLRESYAGLGAASAIPGTSGSRPVDPEEQHFQQFLDSSRQDVSLLPPTTFQMDSLLKEIQSLDYSGHNQQTRGPVQGPNVADLATQKDWAEEFLKNEHSVKVSGAAWAGDYFAAELDPIWEPTSRDGYPFPVNTPIGPIGSIYSQQHSDKTIPTAKELLDDNNWTTNQKTETVEAADKTELMEAAEDFIKSVSDPTIKATEFMSFVEKLSLGDLRTDYQNRPPDADTWASEYSFQSSNNQGSHQDWAQEFASQEGNFNLAPEGAGNVQEGREDFWQKLQDEWERLAQEDASPHPWLTEQTQQIDQPYKFNEENPFLETDDPLSEGKRKLLEGDIPSAVLLFESASQKHPDNPECWFLLGTTQAQNEQDPLAISALNKCLEIQPDNMMALMSLAASLTNESYHLQACNTLKRWLKTNPKYPKLVWPEEVTEASPNRLTTILPSAELTSVQRMFIEAARQNPTTGVDPDIQCGLGILFNLGSEYDKAADCFQAALNVNPDESLLWNRLGATLANGHKSAEAISAYRRALEISPGFIRTRYNLGIACVNLGAYREAAEHFLTSLNMQSAGKTSYNSKPGSVMSDSIWTSLRMILHLLDKGHLSKSIDLRDLTFLNKEFGITP